MEAEQMLKFPYSLDVTGLGARGIKILDTSLLENSLRHAGTKHIIGFNKPDCFKILVGDEYLYPDIQIGKSEFLFGDFYNKTLLLSLADPIYAKILSIVNDIILKFDKAVFSNGVWFNTEFNITHDWKRLSNSCRTVSCLLMDTGGNRIFKSSFIGNNVFRYSIPFLMQYSKSTLMFNSQHTMYFGHSDGEPMDFDEIYKGIYSILKNKYYDTLDECNDEYFTMYQPIWGLVKEDEFVDFFGN